MSHKNIVRFAVDMYYKEKSPTIPILYLKSILTDLYGEINQCKYSEGENDKYM